MSKFRPYFLAEPGKPFPNYETYNKKNYIPPKGDSIIKKTKNLGSAIKKDVLQTESIPKDYKSTWTKKSNTAYKSWLKSNYPNEYYKKYGGKIKDTVTFKKPSTPYKNLKTIGKVGRLGTYAGIAAAVVEGVQYALGTGNIPNSIDEREMLRRSAIESSLAKITYNDKGEAVQVLPDYKKVRELMKDHMPYKKYIERPKDEKEPDVFEHRFRKTQPRNPRFKALDSKAVGEIEGVDYIWLDPMDVVWGDASHHPDYDDYKLTQFGYVKKGN